MALRHRLAQMRLQRQPFARRLRHFFVIKAPRAAPARLGAIHRRVRALQQILGAGGVRWKHTNADASANHHLKTVGRAPRLRHGAEQLARHHRCGLRVAQMAHHHRHFVARHAPQQVARAQRRMHLQRNVFEHRIARRMAVAVVDVFEAVEVNLQHRQHLARGGGLLHRGIELLNKPRAVR